MSRRGAAQMRARPTLGSTSTASTAGQLYRPPDRVVRGGPFVGYRHPGAHEVSRAALDRAARRLRIQQHLARRLDLSKRRFRLMHPMHAKKRRMADTETEEAATCLLEEIADRPLDDPGLQSDLFRRRPPSPQFVPAWLPADASTQVEPCELFDFDVEVAPLLEVLAGLSVRQAMDEAVWEEEHSREHDGKKAFLQARAGELAEVQRLDEHARRLLGEDRRRVWQEPAALEDLELRNRAVAEATLLRGVVEQQGLPPPLALRGLDEEDRRAGEVGGHFLPWLAERVQARADMHDVTKEVLHDIVSEVLREHQHKYLGVAWRRSEPTEPPQTAE